MLALETRQIRGLESRTNGSKNKHELSNEGPVNRERISIGSLV